MGWLGDALDLGGDILDWFGSEDEEDAYKKYGKDAAKEAKRVAKENAKLSRYDADVARESALQIRNRTERNKELYYQQMDRTLASQKNAFANRGVIVGTGSPLDIQVETARAMTRDAEIMVNNGNTAMKQALSLADRYEMLAEAGLREAAGAAYLIREQADMAADNIRWDRYSTGISNLYDVGKDWGWW